MANNRDIEIQKEAEQATQERWLLYYRHLEDQKSKIGSITKTVQDFWRLRKTFFNGDQNSLTQFYQTHAVDEKAAEKSVSDTIDLQLSKANPSVRNYLKLYAHQSGILAFVGFAQNEILLNKGYGTNFTSTRHDFIDNKDGSVTYYQAMPLSNYRELANTDNFVERNNAEPLAMIVVGIKIHPDSTKPNGVSSELITDAIFIFDERAKKVIGDRHAINMHDVSLNKFEREYTGFIANEVQKVSVHEAKNVVKTSPEKVSEEDEFSKALQTSIIETDTTELDNLEIKNIELEESLGLSQHLAPRNYSSIQEALAKQRALKDVEKTSEASMKTSALKNPHSVDIIKFEDAPKREPQQEMLVSAPPVRAAQQPAKPERLSDGQVILRTTFGTATAGAAIGVGIGTAIAFGLIPLTFGASLLAIPIAAGIGFAVGGLIGLAGSALGVALDRIARMPEAKPQVAAAPIPQSRVNTEQLMPNISPSHLPAPPITARRPTNEPVPSAQPDHRADAVSNVEAKSVEPIEWYKIKKPENKPKSEPKSEPESSSPRPK